MRIAGEVERGNAAQPELKNLDGFLSVFFKPYHIVLIYLSTDQTDQIDKIQLPRNIGWKEQALLGRGGIFPGDLFS